MLKNRFLADWKQEFREIADYIQTCADWLTHFADIESPLCAEARRRLRLIQARMMAHFERESEMGAMLSVYRDGKSIEVESIRGSSSLDQKHLLSRVQALIVTLERTECESLDWSSIGSELNLILDSFEQHQEHQEETITWLLPNELERDA